MYIQSILSLSGAMCSVVNNATPVIAINSVTKTRELDKIPFYFLLFNNILQVNWVLYSVMIMSWELIIINTITTALSFAGIMAYFSKSASSYSFWFKYLAFIMVLILVIMITATPQQQGIVCLMFSISSSLFCLQPLKNAIKRKNYRMIELRMSLISTVNSSIWGLFGLITKNNIIIISNTIGLVVGGSSVMAWFYYKYTNAKTKAFFI